MKKVFLSVLLTVLAILSAIGLSSCIEEGCIHEWGEWSVVSSSTCVTQGTKQRKCTKCGEVQDESIDIAEHKYDTDNLVWTWNGYETATATLSCITDSTHTRQINANITDEVTSAPDCTATGIKTYTATVKISGVTYTATKTETLAALGHTEVTDAAIAATCKQTGLTEGSHCSVCNEVLVAQQETPMTAHTAVKLEAVEATCYSEGATEGLKCSVCNEILTAPRATGKIAHTEVTVPAVAATCSEYGLTEGKKCSVCDKILVAQQQTKKLSHTEITLLGVAPSCSEKGLTEGKKCSVCGAITVAQKPIDKLPHTEEIIAGTAPTCSKTGLSDGKKCSVCKEILTAQTILPKIACNYKSDVTSTTCEAQGYTTHTCTMCNDSFVDTYVNALGHNWGAWEVSGSYTLRNCTNECNCGKSQRISSISATYSGDRLLTGESVWKNDVSVTVTLSDRTTLDITDFTLENDVMTVDGSNYVDVKFHTMSTKISVPAIYDNLPGTTSAIEFTYTEKDDAVTITGFVGSSTEIVIPAHINRVPVRNINNRAFEGNQNIVSLTVPASVQSIGECAFSGCSRLKTLTLNEGLKAIYGKAFKGCPIKTLTIPDSVKILESRYEEGAFEDCIKLKSVIIGGGLQYIPDHSFVNCTALKTVVIGNSVETIGECAFANCSALTSVQLGNGLITISNYAFENCTALTTITIPDSVQNVGEHAFKGCSLLVNFNIGTGVQRIGAYALQDCISLKSVAIPANVQVMGSGLFVNCSSLEEVIIEKGVLREIGNDVFSGCSSFNRIYYTGTASDWVLVAVNEDNSYPLNVSPYYYSSTQPTKAGNYWYYNKSGAKRIWNVSKTAFRAEEYSENFTEIFGNESSSYASVFYNDLQNDTTLMLGIQAWELIHITAEPSYIFDPNKGLISKKELYKFTLYDILTGEDAEVEAPFFEFFDSASAEFMLYIGDMYLGDPTEAPIDIKMLYNILHDQDASAIRSVLEKALSPTIIDDVNAIIGFAENAYEALSSVSQYVALRQLKSGYVDVLTAISENKNNPKDLRNAAKELVDWYQDACELTLAKFRLKTFVNATNDDIYSWMLDELVDVAIDSDATGILKAVNFTGKAIRAILEPLKMDDFCEAYYRLKTSVGVESALKRFIKVTVPDHLRYEEQETAETYMCAVELYESSVLCGFEYSIDLLNAYVNSSVTADENSDDYKSLINTLESYKAAKEKTYQKFDSLVSQRYEAYYS